MNKLTLIIRREFLAKVRNKTFIIMTFLSPLLIIGFTALIVFLGKYIDIKKFDNSMGVPDEVMTKIKNQISPPEAWTRSMNKFNSLKVLLLQSIYPLSWLS